MKLKYPFLFLRISFCLAVLGGERVWATDYNWDGSVDGSWSTAANWVGNIAPPLNTNDIDIVFDFSTTLLGVGPQTTTQNVGATFRLDDLDVVVGNAGDSLTINTVGDIVFDNTGGTGPDHEMRVLGNNNPFILSFDGLNNLDVKNGILELHPQLSVHQIVIDNPITSIGNGAFLLKKTGAGKATLSMGPHGYTGGTQVDDGILEFARPGPFSGGGLPGGTLLVNSPGILRFNTVNTAPFISTVSSLSGNGIIDTADGSNTATLLVNTASPSTFTGVISDGAGSVGLILRKDGASTLTLSNPSNTYKGDTQIIAGSLISGSANSFSPNSNINFVTLPASTGILNLNGFSNTVKGLLGGASGGISLGGGTLTIKPSGFNDFYGSGSIAGPGALTVNANSSTDRQILRMSTPMSFSGSTTITQGILEFQQNNNIMSPTSNVVIGANGTLRLQGTQQTVPSVTGVGGNIDLQSTSLLIVNDGGVNTNYQGKITGPGSLTKQGAGIMTLTPVAPGDNTYGAISGGTNIVAGTLRGGSTNAFSANSLHVVSAGATLDLGGFDQRVGRLAGAGLVSLGGNTLTIFGGFNVPGTFSGTMTGTGGLTIATLDSNALFLTSGLAYTGPTTVSGGILRMNAGSSLQSTNVQVTGGRIFLFEPNANPFPGDLTPTISSGDIVILASNALGISSMPIVNSPGVLILWDFINQELAGLTGNGVVISNPGISTLTISGGPSIFNGSIQNVAFLNLDISSAGLFVLAPTVSGVNNYRGTTTISGILEAGTTDNSLSINSAHTILSNGLLRLGIGASEHQIASLASAALDSTVQIAAGVSLRTGFDGTSTIYNGLMNGAGNLVKEGGGDFTLGGVQKVYTGTTTVNNGRLIVGAANVLNTLNSMIVNPSGILALDANQQLGSLTGTGTVNTVSGSRILTLNNAGAVNFTGKLLDGGGTLNLAKVNAGIFTLNPALSGDNTYSGTTTVDVGTLQAGKLNAFSANSVHTVNTPGILNLAGFNNTIAGLSGSGTVSLGTAFLTVSGTINTTFSGGITGTGGLTKAGTSILTLDAPSFTNTYSGLTTVNGGSLFVGALNTIPTGNGVQLSGLGTLSLLADQTLASLTGGGSVRAQVSPHTLTIDNAAPVTFDGKLLDGTAALSLVKSGADVFILNPPSGSNNCSGATTVNNGTLQAGKLNAFSANSKHTVNTPGILNLNNFSQTIASLGGSGTATLGMALLTMNSATPSGDATFTGSITGTGGITKQGSFVWTLDSGVSLGYTGPTIFSAGTVEVNTPNALASTSEHTVNGALNLNGNNQTIVALHGSGSVDAGTGLLTINSPMGVNSMFNGAFGGTGVDTIQKDGQGMFTLSGAQKAYTGITTVNNGQFIVGSTDVILPTNSVIVNSPGMFVLNANQELASLSGLGTVSAGTGMQTFTLNTAGSPSFGGLLTDGTGVLNFEKLGAGIFTLNNNNTYTGTTSISDGTLIVGVNDALPPASPTTIAAGAVLDLNGNDQAISSLSGTGTVTAGVALSSTLTIGDPTVGSSVFDGVIENGVGTLSLIRDGMTASTLTLRGANTYTGTTTLREGGLTVANGKNLPSLSIMVEDGGTFTIDDGSMASGFTGMTTIQSGGSLVVNGNLNSSDVVINSGATLQGAGTVGIPGGNPVVMYGLHQPGNSIDTQYFPSGYMIGPSPAKLEIEIAGPNLVDLIDVTGMASIDPTATLSIIDTDPFGPAFAIDTELVFIQTTAGFGGTSFQNFEIDKGYGSGPMPVGFPAMIRCLTTSVEVLVLITGNQYIIRLGDTLFEEIAPPGNSQTVAGLLDQIPHPPGSDAAAVRTVLLNLPLDGLLDALNQLHPAPATAMGAQAHQNHSSFSSMLSSQLGQGGQGGGGDQRGSRGRPLRAVWAHVVGSSKDQHTEDDLIGHRARTETAITGFDFLNPTPNTLVGFMAAFAHNDVQTHNDQGKASTYTVMGGLYGSWWQDGLFFNGSVLAGMNDFRGHRHMYFGSLDRKAYQEHSGYGFGLHIDGGYRIPVGPFEVTPIAGLDYSYVYENAYSERDANSLNLHVTSRDSDLLRSEIGIKLGRTILAGALKWVHSIKMSYVNKVHIQNTRMRFRFDESGFGVVSGSKKPIHVFAPGVALSLVDDVLGFSITGHYDGEYGKRCMSHTIGLKGEKKF